MCTRNICTKGRPIFSRSAGSGPPPFRDRLAFAGEVTDLLVRLHHSPTHHQLTNSTTNCQHSSCRATFGSPSRFTVWSERARDGAVDASALAGWPSLSRMMNIDPGTSFTAAPSCWHTRHCSSCILSDNHHAPESVQRCQCGSFSAGDL